MLFHLLFVVCFVLFGCTRGLRMKLNISWPTAAVLIVAIVAIALLTFYGHMTLPAAFVDGFFALVLAFAERVVRSMSEASSTPTQAPALAAQEPPREPSK